MVGNKVLAEERKDSGAVGTGLTLELRAEESAEKEVEEESLLGEEKELIVGKVQKKEEEVAEEHETAEVEKVVVAAQNLHWQCCGVLVADPAWRSGASQAEIGLPLFLACL